MDSYLREIVERHVGSSLVSTLGRTTDRIAEQLAEEILRDPVFRERMRKLIEASFEKTLTALLTEPDVKA